MNIMEKKNEFKPYIPADKIVPEFTVTSIVIGIILAVVLGAANAYLGLIFVRIPFSKTILCRQSVPPESL